MSGSDFGYQYPLLEKDGKKIWNGGVSYYENTTKLGTSHHLFQHVGPDGNPTKYTTYTDMPFENGERSVRASKECVVGSTKNSLEYELVTNPEKHQVTLAQRQINGDTQYIDVKEAVAGIRAIVTDFRAQEKRADSELNRIKFAVNPVLDSAESYTPLPYLPNLPKTNQPVVIPNC